MRKNSISKIPRASSNFIWSNSTWLVLHGSFVIGQSPLSTVMWLVQHSWIGQPGRRLTVIGLLCWLTDFSLQLNVRPSQKLLWYSSGLANLSFTPRGHHLHTSCLPYLCFSLFWAWVTLGILILNICGWWCPFCPWCPWVGQPVTSSLSVQHAWHCRAWHSAGMTVGHLFQQTAPPPSNL